MPASLSVLCPLPSVFCASLFAFLALCYLPIRLIQGELTSFRFVDWALGFETVGLTLLAVFMVGGWKWVGRLAFPICFILIAIPWPTQVESRSIHGLAIADSMVSAELLGWLDIPAIVRGRTIEISTGVVGVNDACSGIRSLQSCLMLSILLGELFRLSLLRRVTLVIAGFVLAFVFNVCRTSLLVWVASRRGIAAIADWHDSAGIVITLGCLLGLCVVAYFLKRVGRRARGRGQRTEDRGQKAQGGAPVDGGRCVTGEGLVDCGQWINAEGDAGKAESRKQNAEVLTSGGARLSSDICPLTSVESPLATDASQLTSDLWPLTSGFSTPASGRLLSWLSIALLVWLVGVEVGARVWTNLRGAAHANTPQWTVNWPVDNSSFKLEPIAPETLEVLGCNRAQQAVWSDGEGGRWQVFLLEWFPGRFSRLFATRHTPDICMKLNGFEVMSASDVASLPVHGLSLPFRRYAMKRDNAVVHVFYCYWDEGTAATPPSGSGSQTYDLLRGAWVPRQELGHQVLEIAVSGYPDLEKAQEAVVRELEKMIRVEEKGKAEISR